MASVIELERKVYFLCFTLVSYRLSVINCINNINSCCQMYSQSQQLFTRIFENVQTLTWRVITLSSATRTTQQWQIVVPRIVFCSFTHSRLPYLEMPKVLQLMNLSCYCQNAVEEGAGCGKCALLHIKIKCFSITVPTLSFCTVVAAG